VLRIADDRFEPMFNTPTFPRAIPTLTLGSEFEDFGQSETETTQPVKREGDRTVTDWLDAFVADECDRAVLLRGVADAVTSNRDQGWDLLALVDQYYRRKKISADDFRALNAQLQVFLFGNPPILPVTPANAVPTPAPAPSAFDSTTTSVPTPKPARAIAIGEVLRDRYRIQGILGRGGMGTVYSAIDEYRLNDEQGDQRVAIKVLNAEASQRPELLAELRGEFQRLQTLSHPNIVRVHDFDRDGELTFFIMEHLSGAPLARVLAMRNAAALHRSHALAIISQLGEAVAYAHSRGVVHGDLSPRNIFITDDGELRVLDFGASHRLHPDTVTNEPEDPSRIAVATPSYASCELLVGRLADTRDDIYSLACIFYVLLRGEHPFHGSNALVARTKNLTARRPAGLSAQQWRALKAGLQVDRKRRPDNLQAWLNDLSFPHKSRELPILTILMGALPPRERTGPGVMIALIALAGGLIWWAQTNPELVRRIATNLTTSALALRQQVTPAARHTAAASQRESVGGQSAAPPSPAIAPAAPPPAELSEVAVTAVHRAPAALPTASAHEPVATAAQAAATTPARIELAADTVEVAPLQPVASVTVQRRRNYRNGVSFSWWTESGTAVPGRDFVPVKARMDYIAAGESETHLLVPIVSDPRRRLARTFYVVVGGPSTNAALGSRTITLVTIPALN